MKLTFSRTFMAVIAAVLIAGCDGESGSGIAGFNSIPSAFPEHYPSHGVEAEGLTSIGDRITLESGTPRGLSAVTATLVSWACQSGTWNAHDCTSTEKTFSHEVTLNIYDDAVSPTVPVATKTQSFDMPYRPDVDHTCDSDPVFAGGWRGKDGNCVDGLAFKIKFDLSSLKVTLPDTVRYELSFNTTNHGPSPIHGTEGPYPYDSLNFGVAYPAVVPIVGSHPDQFGYLYLNGSLTDDESSMVVRFDVVPPIVFGH